MSVEKARPILIQERDIRVFQLASELGYVNAEYLLEHGLFSNKRSAEKRLTLLTRARYLGTHLVSYGSRGKLVYFPIAEKYRGYLEKDDLVRAQKTVQFKPWLKGYSRHESILRSWALRFMRIFDNVRVDMDFMLYNNSSLGGEIPLHMQERLPDMIVDINNLAPIYVEIELTQKTNRRYESKVQDEMKRRNGRTLYLTDMPAIKSAVTRAVDKVVNAKGASAHTVDGRIRAYLFSELEDDSIFRAKILELGSK